MFSGSPRFSCSRQASITSSRRPGCSAPPGTSKLADTNFNPTPTNDGCDRNAFGLARVSGVGAVAAVCTNDIQLDGDPVTGWGFTPVRGTIEPEIVVGRTPRSSREVALGSVTLDALGKSIGDTVQGRGPNGTAQYRIVGQVAFPKLGDPQALADGAAFTGTGLSHVFDSNNSSNRFLLGRFTPGSDQAAVEHRIAALPGLGNPAGSTVPVEVNRLRHIDWFPTTLAALLASLALLAVGHTLVTGVRRRRHDLALLKTLGFNRSQIRATRRVASNHPRNRRARHRNPRRHNRRQDRVGPRCQRPRRRNHSCDPGPRPHRHHSRRCRAGQPHRVLPRTISRGAHGPPSHCERNDKHELNGRQIGANVGHSSTKASNTRCALSQEDIAIVAAIFER